LKKKLPLIDLDEQIIVFLDQSAYQNRCNSGKLWFKPELGKNIIIRNPDRFKINAFGSYSPNGSSTLQFKETSKTFDMMTFLAETRKVNMGNKDNMDKLELLLTKYYNSQKKIVSEFESMKYNKNEIKGILIKDRLEQFKERIKNIGEEYTILIDQNYSLIYSLISSNISDKEINDAKILKKEYDKNNRINKEIKLAKSLADELNSDYWLNIFSCEKEINLVLDNATIHKAILTKAIAKSLNIVLIYLPKYASDLNPIERLWYSIKNVLSTDFIEDINFLKENFELYFYEYTQTESLAREFIQEFII
jgi:hypothetical protein